METLFNAMLVVHIISGFTAFLVAPVAMMVKKGGSAHRKWGRVFFWAMCVVCITALVMAPIHKNIFLTLVAVFSFYLAFNGYRALYRKNLAKTQKVAGVDWFFTILNTVFSAGLVLLGVFLLPDAFGIISLVFGTIGTWGGIRDLRTFIRPKARGKKWFFDHMAGMIGAYIAALSAFSAVNFNFSWLPTALQWLWPTLIGVPLMFVWMKQYKKKFNKGGQVKQLAEIQIQAEFSE